jgi:hypothetical protein
MVATFAGLEMFRGIEPFVADLASTARAKCETLHTDADIFDVWASFVAAAERLSCFRPRMPADPSLADEHYAWQGLDLIRSGKDLISYVTRARVPMPKSTCEWKERCEHYCESLAIERAAAPARAMSRSRTPLPSLRAAESDVSSARAAATPPR